jgi:hypothetical protein
MAGRLSSSSLISFAILLATRGKGASEPLTRVRRLFRPACSSREFTLGNSSLISINARSAAEIGPRLFKNSISPGVKESL